MCGGCRESADNNTYVLRDNASGRFGGYDSSIKASWDLSKQLLRFVETRELLAPPQQLAGGAAPASTIEVKFDDWPLRLVETRELAGGAVPASTIEVKVDDWPLPSLKAKVGGDTIEAEA